MVLVVDRAWRRRAYRFSACRSLRSLRFTFGPVYAWRLKARPFRHDSNWGWKNASSGGDPSWVRGVRSGLPFDRRASPHPGAATGASEDYGKPPSFPH